MVKLSLLFPLITAFNASVKKDGGIISNDNVNSLEHVLALISGANGSLVN